MSSNQLPPDPTGEFPLDAPEYFFYLMFLTNRHREMAFDAALASVGLTLNRWRTLSILRRLTVCTMNELARFSTIDRTTLTRSVDQLVAQGIVIRGGAANDRRKVEIRLTIRGESAYQSALGVLQSFNHMAMTGISVDAQRQIVRSMKVILGNIVPDPGRLYELIEFARQDTTPATDEPPPIETPRSARR